MPLNGKDSSMINPQLLVCRIASLAGTGCTGWGLIIMPPDLALYEQSKKHPLTGVD
jgi:hypothetical protein